MGIKIKISQIINLGLNKLLIIVSSILITLIIWRIWRTVKTLAFFFFFFFFCSNLIGLKFEYYFKVFKVCLVLLLKIFEIEVFLSKLLFERKNISPKLKIAPKKLKILISLLFFFFNISKLDLGQAVQKNILIQWIFILIIVLNLEIERKMCLSLFEIMSS